MQLTANTTATKTLPVDLMPELSHFHSHRSLQADAVACEAQWTLRNSKAAACRSLELSALVRAGGCTYVSFLLPC